MRGIDRMRMRVGALFLLSTVVLFLMQCGVEPGWDAGPPCNPGNCETLDTRMAFIVDSPGFPGWPAGDALRICISYTGPGRFEPAATLNGSDLVTRGVCFEPRESIELLPDSAYSIAIFNRGSYLWGNRYRIPEPPEIISPVPDADLRGNRDIVVRWPTRELGNPSWIAVETPDGKRRFRRAWSRYGEDTTWVSVPITATSEGRGRIYLCSIYRTESTIYNCLECGYRVDMPLADSIGDGIHYICWTAPREVLLGGVTPPPSYPQTLRVHFVLGEPVQIDWLPRTSATFVRISIEQLPECGPPECGPERYRDVVWEISSIEGFLPPLTYGMPPAGARTCVPTQGSAPPLSVGMTYIVEVEGPSHAGSVRGVPVPARAGLAVTPARGTSLHPPQP
jgi:hypothetical protein